MTPTHRFFLTAWLAAVTIGSAGGCDRDDSSSSSSSAPPATPAQQPVKSTGTAGATADADEPADDAPASDDALAAQPPTAPKVQTPDVATPPSVDGAPVKAGFIFYIAKEKPGVLSAFHRTDLEAKGWKLGRNDAGKVPDSTLDAVVQEYRKGGDVLTIALTEHPAAEGSVSMVMVMDIPLPPKAQVAVAFPFVLVQTTDTADAASAWLKKELSARGWTAGAQTDARSAQFTKGARNLQAIMIPRGGTNTGVGVQLMHTAPAE